MHATSSSCRPWHWHVPKSNVAAAWTCRASSANSRKDGVNFYKVLSLDSSKAGADEIRRAYRSMVLRYHPDVCAPAEREESTRLFIELHRAYRTLSDPAMREKYDHNRLLDHDQGDRFPKEVWMDQLSRLNARSINKRNASNIGR